MHLLDWIILWTALTGHYYSYSKGPATTATTTSMKEKRNKKQLMLLSFFGLSALSHLYIHPSLLAFWLPLLPSNSLSQTNPRSSSTYGGEDAEVDLGKRVKALKNEEEKSIPMVTIPLPGSTHVLTSAAHYDTTLVLAPTTTAVASTPTYTSSGTSCLAQHNPGFSRRNPI